MLPICNIHSKGNKGRRHINILKGAWHAVLSSDGRKSKSNLGAVCTKKSRKRLAPARRILRHPAEILLEGKADSSVIAAWCHDFGNRGQYCINCAVIGAPAWQVGIIATAHHGHGMCFSMKYRKLCHHGLSLCQLVPASIGHEHASRSYGTVKHFHKPFLGTNI